MSAGLHIFNRLYDTTEINVCTFKTLVFKADCIIYNHTNLVSTYYVKKDGFLMFYTYTLLGGVKKNIDEVKLFEYNVEKNRLSFVSSSGGKFTCDSFFVQEGKGADETGLTAGIRKKIVQKFCMCKFNRYRQVSGTCWLNSVVNICRLSTRFNAILSMFLEKDPDFDTFSRLKAAVNADSCPTRNVLKALIYLNNQQHISDQYKDVMKPLADSIKRHTVHAVHTVHTVVEKKHEEGVEGESGFPSDALIYILSQMPTLVNNVHYKVFNTYDVSKIAKAVSATATRASASATRASAKTVPVANGAYEFFVVVLTDVTVAPPLVPEIGKYELDCAVKYKNNLRNHHILSHVVAAFTCNDTKFTYNSNDTDIKKDAWVEKNDGTKTSRPEFFDLLIYVHQKKEKPNNNDNDHKKLSVRTSARRGERKIDKNKLLLEPVVEE